MLETTNSPLQLSNHTEITMYYNTRRPVLFYIIFYVRTKRTIITLIYVNNNMNCVCTLLLSDIL